MVAGVCCLHGKRDSMYLWYSVDCMRIILLTDMKGIGAQGDVCDVKDGYAMNLLIPQKKAAECTGEQALQARQKRAASDRKREQGREQAAAVIESLPDTVTVQMSANEGGKLFSAVTKDTLGERLRADGFAVNSEWFSFDPIKEVGSRDITVARGDTKKTVTIVVAAR